MVQLDARWYNPHSSRFQQPDYWNLRNTHLPAAIQHELMRFTGLNTAQLLNDPSQQLAYGYVSGNPLGFVDPLGLCPKEAPDYDLDNALSNPSSQGLKAVNLDPGSALAERIEEGYKSISSWVQNPTWAGAANVAASVILGKRADKLFPDSVTKGVDDVATGLKGSKGFELKNTSYQKTRNADGVVDGREYTGHAFDQMQNRGVMPSVVENAVKNGTKTPDPIPGRIRNYDADNNITIITEGEKVVTVIRGKR